MTDPVTLVRWRRADTDPPDDHRLVVTDRGFGRFMGPRGLPRDAGHGVVWFPLRSDTEWMFPQPSWWCDPTPPGGDALTENDLVWAVGAVDDLTRRHEADGPTSQAGQEYARQGREVSARLRTALDALDRKDTP
jgi:hypothetical protein